MRTKYTIYVPLFVLAVGLFFGSSLFAAADDSFGSAEILKQAGHIRAFLFGPVLKIVGIAAAAWGLIQAFASSSLKPIWIFGGIALASLLLPKFIDGIFPG